MNRCRLSAYALVVVAGLTTAAVTVAVAEPSKDAQPSKNAKSVAQPEMQLPPGWTQQDMQACMEAGTPGKMHQHLAKDVGTWEGKCSITMAPGAEPITSPCTSTITSHGWSLLPGGALRGDAGDGAVSRFRHRRL